MSELDKIIDSSRVVLKDLCGNAGILLDFSVTTGFVVRVLHASCAETELPDDGEIAFLGLHLVGLLNLRGRLFRVAFNLHIAWQLGRGFLTRALLCDG